MTTKLTTSDFSFLAVIHSCPIPAAWVGYLKLEAAQVLVRLDNAGLVTRSKGSPAVYRTTPAGRRALDASNDGGTAGEVTP